MSATIKLSCENVSPFSGCDPLLLNGGQEQPQWNFCFRVSPCGAATPLYLLGGEKQPRWSQNSLFRLDLSPSKGCNPPLYSRGGERQPRRSHETKTSAQTAGGDLHDPNTGRRARREPQSLSVHGRGRARGASAGLLGAHPPGHQRNSSRKTGLPFPMIGSHGRGAA